ncbi:MAG: PEGA domain-containing protein [bacterium]|nr:PEGA domain-containing protein [bacterium]MDZ4299298.1 PEGA domain-containing protein [Candidatus Sungbacteria bacterium]
MTRALRRLILYGLIVVFLIVGPFLIAYSLGYTLNLKEGAVERTGGIFISATIPNVAVFLDGTLVKETSFLAGAVFLTKIPPGIHLVRVEKKGYLPWSKTVTVQPQVVTEFRNVLLIPGTILMTPATPAQIKLITAIRALPAPPITRVSSNNVITHDVEPKQPTFRLNASRTLLQEGAGTPKTIAKNIHSFGTRDGVALFIDQNGFLDRYDQTDGMTHILGRPGFFLDAQPARFFYAPGGQTVILDSAGGMFLLDTADTITSVTGEVRDLSFSPNGTKALIVKDDRIEIFWLTNHTRQPFQKPGSRDTFDPLADPIKQAQWYYADTDHVFIRTSAEVLMSELDARGGRNMRTVVNGKTDAILTLPDLPHTLFYQQNKNWFTIEW